MTGFQWRDWFAKYNRDLFADFDQSILHLYHPDQMGITPDVIASGWFGYPGATEMQLVELETRLKSRLPPSYRSFLAASNGFWQPGQNVFRLLSTTEIDWLTIKDPLSIEAWIGGERDAGPARFIPDEDYFVYGDEQSTLTMRSEFLRTALLISEGIDGETYLLNPLVVTEEGEWEAWLWAPKLAGALRYHSFWDLMQTEYKNFVEMTLFFKRRLWASDTPDTLVKKVSNLVEDLDEKIRTWQRVADVMVNVDGHHGGIVRGLDYAKQQVLAIKSRNLTADVMRQELRELAQLLSRKHMEDHKAMMKLPEMERILSLLQKSAGDLNVAIEEKSVFEGYREAAGIIEWFLNQEDFNIDQLRRKPSQG